MRFLRLGRAVRCALVGLTTTLALCSISAPGIANAMPAQDDTGWLLGQINVLRAQIGVGPLALNAQLVNSSTGHSTYLANNPWTDPHVESNGSTPRSRIAAAGYPSSIIGENVYGGGLATAQIAFTWWIHSPIHYEGMVNPVFNDIGIGIASGPYGQYFTTDFGGHGGGAPAQPPAVPVGAGQSPASVPTHRPAPPRPTTTPTQTLTPSIAFTPYPTATPTVTITPIPPTSTAIELAVSPQPGLVVAALPSDTSIPPTNAPSAVPPAASPTPKSVQAVLAGFAAPRSAPDNSGSNPIRTLLPFVLGLQAIIVGGLLLRRGRSR